MKAAVLPGPIEDGWLALHDLEGCEVLDAPHWAAREDAWIFSVRLSADAVSELVAEHTDWLITIEATYPTGDVAVYPAANSLESTFQHQSQNLPAEPGAHRRGGKLCLTVAWNDHRHRDHTLPPDSADLRLRWTIQRAREWLRRAATGTLVAPGDPFELPDFGAQIPPDLGRIVAPGVLCEGDWLERSEIAWGELDWNTFKPGPGASRITLLRERRSSSAALRFNPWGPFLAAQNGTSRRGAWLWLPSPPILRPWQAPRTWGELRAWALALGLDLDRPLGELGTRFRSSKTIVVVGFPVPAKIADPFTRSAWQAFELPPPNRVTLNKPGRRAGRPVPRDPLGNDSPIVWLSTQTWSPDRLAVRGVADPRLADQRIALIGVGAIGSRLAELLVRAGVRRLKLIDGDSIQAGNLVRHSATLRALGLNKAELLANELQAAAPFAQITASTVPLPTTPEDAASMLSDTDVIIDATASDAVLRTLSTLPGEHTRRWLSISLGRHAARLYCYLASAPRFPLPDFAEGFRPWHADDVTRYPEPLPWEGAGCWSPVFPARVDDITSLISLAVRELERLITHPPAPPELRVHERTCDDDGTVLAIRRVASPEPRREQGLTRSSLPIL